MQQTLPLMSLRIQEESVLLYTMGKTFLLVSLVLVMCTFEMVRGKACSNTNFTILNTLPENDNSLGAGKVQYIRT